MYDSNAIYNDTVTVYISFSVNNELQLGKA